MVERKITGGFFGAAIERPPPTKTPPPAPVAVARRVVAPEVVGEVRSLQPTPPRTPYVAAPPTYDEHVKIVGCWTPDEFVVQLRRMGNMHKNWGWSYDLLLAAAMIERLTQACATAIESGDAGKMRKILSDVTLLKMGDLV